MSDIATKIAKEAGALKLEQWRVEKVIPYDANPRKIGPEAVRKLKEAIAAYGFNVPIVVDENGVILAGHTRRQAALQLGLKVVPVIVKPGLTEAQKREWRIADNRVAEELLWDDEKLKLEFAAIEGLGGSTEALGFDKDEVAKLMSLGELSLEDVEDAQKPAKGQKPLKTTPNGSLAAKFGVPPFSVIDTRGGWWQARKKAWLGLLGKNSGIAEGLTYPKTDGDAVSAAIGEKGTTSSFDPVLAELVYRWFSPAGGVVLDPFAGGAVRGVVASRLGRVYHGIDVRQEQVEANVRQSVESQQAHAIVEMPPSWYVGDSRDLDNVIGPSPQLFADLVFTCPPYADLERYSDQADDLSNMSYSDFLMGYRRVIELAANRLKPCRFAVIVIGDARGEDGMFYGLPWRTQEFAEAAGLRLYNQAVLLTPAGTAPVRARQPFEASRKLATTHQYVMVFVKGDPVAATRDVGPCEFGGLEGEDGGSQAPSEQDPAADVVESAA